MKKLFTLLVATICTGAVFAQYDHGIDQRRNELAYPSQDYRNNHYYNSDFGYDRGMDNRRMHKTIDRINWKFDSKISGVQRNWYMNPFEKERLIRSLELQRREEIRMVYGRFGGRGFDNDRRYDRGRF